MFFSAMLGYLILCRARLSRSRAHQKQGQHEFNAETPSDVCKTAVDSACKEPCSDTSIYEKLMNACKEGDHATVVSCWDVVKQLEQTPLLPLPEIVKSIRSCKKDVQDIATELANFLKTHPEACSITSVNEILACLSEQCDSELMQTIVDVLPSVGLERDQSTCELLLKVYVASRDLSDVERLVADMHAKKLPLSNRAVFYVLKSALQMQDFQLCLKYFCKLKLAWEDQMDASEQLMPHSLMLSFVDLASKEQGLGVLAQELKGMPLPVEVIDAMLAKCVEAGDSDMARSVESLARAQRETLPDSTLRLLIRGMPGRPLRARGVVEEVLSRSTSHFSADLALTVLEFCGRASDAAIADKLLERMKPKQFNVLSAFMWFYIGVEQYEKACDVYELNVQHACSHAGRTAPLDASLQESLVDAAVVCGREQLAQRLLAQSSASQGCMEMITGLSFRLHAYFEAHLVEFARLHAVASAWVVLIF